MKKRVFYLAILAVLLVFGLVMSCGPVEEEEPGEATLISVTANGSGLDTTTQLTLTFDKAVPNFTVTLGSGASKGNISGSGPTYTLSVSGITADATVSVTVSKSNWTITGNTKTVDVKYSASGKAAKYFGGYSTAYDLAGKNVNEYVKFEKNRIMMWDNSNTTKTEYLDFEITKWEDDTTPTFIASVQVAGIEKDNFPNAFKITGKIKGANPINSDNLYGTKTAPGFKQEDINTTSAVIYLYIGGGDSDDDVIDLTVLRSILTKTGDNIQPITGSDGAIRYYRVPTGAVNYPTIN